MQEKQLKKMRVAILVSDDFEHVEKTQYKLFIFSKYIPLHVWSE